ncbi:LysO family transporter [Wukongibacter baidiensis]|uniref:LysO family transporter n=1 Tax=Wukongibacter baidiensis TaxID=1723361 RepID=UPI003D7FAF2A
MRILLYIVIISIGALVGYKELVSEKLSSKMSSLQYFCLLFLLFVMGVKIGVNKNVLMSVHKLGFTAIVISIFSIGFSILGVKLISKYIKAEKKVN